MAVFKNTLSLDVSGFISSVKQAIGLVDKIPDPKIKVSADTSDVKSAAKEIDHLDDKPVNVKVNVDTAQVKKEGSALGGILGGAIGGAGFGLATQGLQSLVHNIKEGALAGDDLGDTLEVAFKQAGIQNVNAAIEETTKANLTLANTLGQDVKRIDELSTAAAGLAGASGEINTSMTKAAVGIETLSGGAVKGEAVIKALSRGLQDPEGAAAIDALAKKYPQLSDTLRGTGDAATKLAAINKELGPTFETLEEQAQGPDAILQKLQNTMGRAFETAGAALFEAIGPVATTLNEVLTPLLESLGPAIGGIVASLAPLLQSLATQLAPVLKTLGDALAPIIGNLVKALLPLVNTLFPVFVALLQAFAPIAIKISSVISDLVQALVKGLAPAFDVLAEILPQIFDAISPLVEAMGDQLKPTIKAVAELLGKLLAAILPIIPPILNVLIPIIKILSDLMSNGLHVAIRVVVGVLSLLLDGIIGITKFFGGLLTQLKEAVLSIPLVGKAFAAIPQVIELVKKAINDLLQQLPDWVKDLLGIAHGSDNVTASLEKQAEATEALTAEQIKANAAAEGDAAAKKKQADASEAAKKRLEAEKKAIADINQSYAEQREKLALLTKQRETALIALSKEGKLSGDQLKIQIEGLKRTEATEAINLAKKVFGAVLGSDGLPILVNTLFDSKDGRRQLEALFTQLRADAVALAVPITFTVERPNQIVEAIPDSAKAVEIPIEVEPVTDLDILAADFGEKLTDLAESVDVSGIISSFFEESGEASNEEQQKQLDQLNENLKGGLASYQEFADGVAGVQAEIVSDSDSVGKALLKTAGELAQTLLNLYIPNIIGAASALLGPIAGLVVGGAAVASLKALLSQALSGFYDGGYTGNVGTHDVAGVVHGREFVLNAEATRRERPLAEFMNAGGTSMDWYKKNMATIAAPMPSYSVSSGGYESHEALKVLYGIESQLKRFPEMTERRSGVELEVGFDSYLYEKDQRRARIRRLR